MQCLSEFSERSQSRTHESHRAESGKKSKRFSIFEETHMNRDVIDNRGAYARFWVKVMEDFRWVEDASAIHREVPIALRVST